MQEIDYVLYLTSHFLGAAGAWMVANWGSRLSLLDQANQRSSHEGIVPKGGGIGVLAAFLVVSWALGLPLIFWVCVGLTSLLSLYGDRRELSPKIRLSLQFLAGVGLVLGMVNWAGFGWGRYLLIPFLSVFVVGTANYYNFMDGIDGIAGITGVVGFGLLAWFAVSHQASPRFLTLSICMGLACLGFLPFNMPKARVFMGDVGSVLLGFVYAGLVIGLSRSLEDFLVLCSFLFPFYADELTTEYVRLRDGENLLKPHRRHVYQLLANEMGVSHWKVSVGYGVLQAMVGIGALSLRGYGTLYVVVFLGLCFAGFGGFGCWVRERGERRGPRKARN
ncbi:MAG: glycosyltransferase family 4 protein [Deltaproteobacteria bacterium]|nr:glycosyltransferase family 4 protein [Deltaproteobacteria bacterium]